MSLKGFHVVFIAVCLLFCGGLAFWGLHDYSQSKSGGSLALGLAAVAGLGGLAVYGKWFLKKLKHLSYA